MGTTSRLGNTLLVALHFYISTAEKGEKSGADLAPTCAFTGKAQFIPMKNSLIL